MKTLEEIWSGAQKGVTAAALIFNAAGEVLLVKHSDGMLNWEVPGGAAEPHEGPAGTAVREVREEIGLIVRAERLTGVYYQGQWQPWGTVEQRRPDGREVIHFTFLYRAAPDGDPRPGEDGEITACAYRPVDALPRPMSDLTVLRIQDALAPLAATATRDPRRADVVDLMHIAVR